MIRLGAALSFDFDDPEAIARAYVAAGYTSAVCPPLSLEEPERVRAVREAFARHDLLLAEVGVWNNLLEPDEEQRRKNIEATSKGLALAEEVGALCCVNIGGSYNPTCWDGPHPRNLTAEAFAAVVETTRQIIDAVQPSRASYTLEGLPWALPESPKRYLELIAAVDRDAFAVHLDPVNWVVSPAHFYDTTALLHDCFRTLGPWIVACHAKDIVLRERLTVHLEEVPPGQGGLDYATYLRELARLPGEMPLILEHLPQEQYPAAREAVLREAAAAGVTLYEQ